MQPFKKRAKDQGTWAYNVIYVNVLGSYIKLSSALYCTFSRGDCQYKHT